MGNLDFHYRKAFGQTSSGGRIAAPQANLVSGNDQVFTTGFSKADLAVVYWQPKKILVEVAASRTETEFQVGYDESYSYEFDVRYLEIPKGRARAATHVFELIEDGIYRLQFAWFANYELDTGSGLYFPSINVQFDWDDDMGDPFGIEVETTDNAGDYDFLGTFTAGSISKQLYCNLLEADMDPPGVATLDITVSELWT